MQLMTRYTPLELDEPYVKIIGVFFVYFRGSLPGRLL
jgi:hypothetical protein